MRTRLAIALALLLLASSALTSVRGLNAYATADGKGSFLTLHGSELHREKPDVHADDYAH